MTQTALNNGAVVGRLILFVSGDSPRSQRARSNLEQALRRSGVERAELEEINLLEAPDKAVEYGIFATPALMDARDPDNPAVLYGDLSDEDGLRRFLAVLELPD